MTTFTQPRLRAAVWTADGPNLYIAYYSKQMKSEFHQSKFANLSTETTHFHFRFLGDRLHKWSAVAELSDRLATKIWGRKLRAVPSWGELGPHLTHYHLGRGLPPYQVASR